MILMLNLNKHYYYVRVECIWDLIAKVYSSNHIDAECKVFHMFKVRWNWNYDLGNIDFSRR